MSSKGKHRKKRVRTEEEKCLLCLSTERDVSKFGQMFKFNDIYVHYYCLLLSSGLCQRGKDNEGIYGFLENDISKEIKRGEKLRCNYCKAFGATIGCSVKTCKVSFHLPCGQQNSALNQFFDKFDSFCVKHRKPQKLDSGQHINKECPTCYSKVDFDGGIQVLATPCCHKLCHRLCIQKQALSAGYFFKCPLCNNKRKFIDTMKEYGIYVPKQDASWETESNAYRELYQRYSRCDQNSCVCPNGRQYHNESNWQLLICETCGSKGTHWKCIGLSNYIDSWKCNDCQNVEHKVANRSKDSNYVYSSDESESDIEIISTVFSNSIENKINISTNLSNNSNQIFEINVLDEIQEKKVRPEMKDVSIQCTLVDAKDLIDTHEFYPSPNYRKSNFLVNSPNTEVISIDSDDDIILLN